MRVLHYVDENRLSWAQAWIQLLEALRQKGIENFVLCRPGGTLHEMLAQKGFTVFTCKPAIPWAPPLCACIKDVIKAVKPDVIHTRLSQAALLGGYWGKRLGVPVLCTVDKYPKAKYYKYAAHLAACSNDVARHMISQGFDGKKVTVVSNPIDVSRYEKPKSYVPQMRKSKSIPQDIPVILAAGRFVDWKGFDVLIKACAKLEGVDFRLWLAGDGPQRKSLENLAAGLDMTSHITFWGFLDDIRPLMWESDLFVLPSKTPEPFGIVALEAMACGLPVIATNAGGVLDFVDETCGWLVRPNDPDDLAAAIKKALICDEIRRTKAIAAKEKALKFDVSKIAEQYVALYYKLGL
ncbi:glycosyltransferase [Acetomicrobium mobile DSM 13181]|uniref:Glycosyltransferase n=1 Tax=Acetomicrobium mobile (strain ATCC BAA-54 / DSM 13181 / JCM 12221 / NGA) TaxID=891968 RepID=I4BVB5_ACEMN|nr:glycosyltransferase family 4 protein [Acetomicrobium mobile]AFM21222.1 glycosyltransferase [Acetomicrobium mobile DSM 13181]